MNVPTITDMLAFEELVHNDSGLPKTKALRVGMTREPSFKLIKHRRLKLDHPPVFHPLKPACLETSTLAAPSPNLANLADLLRHPYEVGKGFAVTRTCSFSRLHILIKLLKTCESLDSRPITHPTTNGPRCRTKRLGHRRQVTLESPTQNSLGKACAAPARLTCGFELESFLRHSLSSSTLSCFCKSFARLDA